MLPQPLEPEPLDPDDPFEPDPPDPDPVEAELFGVEVNVVLVTVPVGYVLYDNNGFAPMLTLIVQIPSAETDQLTLPMPKVRLCVWTTPSS